MYSTKTYDMTNISIPSLNKSGKIKHFYEKKPTEFYQPHSTNEMSTLGVSNERGNIKTKLSMKLKNNMIF